MNDDLKQKIKSGQLLELIRERPELYLGERSLSALWHYLHGFDVALSAYFDEPKSRHALPPDFHDWVAYRLHFYESTTGYRNMILKRVPDESAALDRFFGLLDEHRKRNPRVVALAHCDKKFTRYMGTDDHREKVQAKTIPSPLKLIAYTDDPGFLVTSDDKDADFPWKDRFFPTLKMFESWCGVRKEDFTVLDAEAFNRWLSEEDRAKECQ